MLGNGAVAVRGDCDCDWGGKGALGACGVGCVFGKGALGRGGNASVGAGDDPDGVDDVDGGGGSGTPAGFAGGADDADDADGGCERFAAVVEPVGPVFFGKTTVGAEDGVAIVAPKSGGRLLTGFSAGGATGRARLAEPWIVAFGSKG